jgi:uncharacterized protein (DUF433 family)
MSTKPRGIHLESALEREIQAEANLRGQSFSAASAELLKEAVRMRRAPGIVFNDGPTGRRATIAGTGVDVWEVIARYKALGGDPQKTREEFSWLTNFQFHAALSYYNLYPEEIDARLGREEQFTPEMVYERYSFLTPRGT